MSDRNIGRDILKDYIPVHERIEAFYARHPEGTLQAEIVPELTTESRICMRALAYRAADDPRPGVGYSWLAVPGPTPYTRGSEIENCETSAWGRAIASLGFEVKRGIATAEEVQSKAGARPPDVAPERVDRDTGEIRAKDAPIPLGPYIGEGAVFIRPKPPTDGLLRTGPTGFYVVFGLDLGGGKRIAQVHAQGVLAADLMDALGGTITPLVGQKVLVEGELFRVPITKDGRDLAFERLELGRIETAEFTLPVPVLNPEGQDELFGEPVA